MRPAPATNTVSSPPPQEAISPPPSVVAPTAVPEEVPSHTHQETRVPLVAPSALEESSQNSALDASNSKKSFIDVRSSVLCSDNSHFYMYINGGSY